VHAEDKWLGAGDSSLMDALQVSHFLLSPNFDHLARVALVVSVSESIFSRDITIAILEDQNRGLVNLDSTMFSVLCPCVINVCLESS